MFFDQLTENWFVSIIGIDVVPDLVECTSRPISFRAPHILDNNMCHSETSQERMNNRGWLTTVNAVHEKSTLPVKSVCVGRGDGCMIYDTGVI